MIKKTLKDFKSSLRSVNLFTDANGKLPIFLNENLLDEARTIKVFRNDSVAYIKIFYFQFLKLCFQTQDVDYDTKINKFIETLQKNINLLQINPKFCKQQLSNDNIKDIVFEFLQIISQCKQPVQASLARYPAIGDIFTNFFVNYLKNFYNVNSNSYNTIQSIKILTQFFEVDIMEHDDCIQFTDAQVYSYKNKEDQIFMVYIDQSKVQRNSCMEQHGSFQNLKSNKSIDPENCQVIKFDAPDIVFDEGQSKVQVIVQNLSKQCFLNNNNNINNTLLSKNEQKDKSKMARTDFQSTNYESEGQNQQTFTTSMNASKLKQLFLPQNKQNLETNQINITKQFTDTFILDNIIIQPYRSKIKQLKTKAREQRKSRQPFFI